MGDIADSHLESLYDQDDHEDGYYQESKTNNQHNHNMPVAGGNRSATRRPAAKKQSGDAGKALGLDPGDIITHLSGVITKIYKLEEKSGQYGPFTIQNCEIEVEEINGTRLDETVAIRVSIFDEELPDDFKDTVVTFKSVKNKGALSGVSYETNESKGKLYENVKVAGKIALIEQAEGDGGEPEPAPARQQQSAPPRPAERQTSAPPARQQSTGSRVEYDNQGKPTAGQIIYASALVHEECFIFVQKHYADHKEKWPELAATIFIQSSMKGAVDRKLVELGNLREKSSAPVGLGQERRDPAESQELPDYSDWRNIIIPVGSEEIKGQKLGEIDNFIRFQLWEFLVKKQISTGKEPTEFGKFVLAAGEELDYEKNPPRIQDQQPEDDDIPF